MVRIYHRIILIANAYFSSELAGIKIDPNLPNLTGVLNLDKWKKEPTHKPYIVIVPGTSNLKKAWSTENFSHIAKKLDPNIKIVICGALSEKNRTKTLETNLKNEGRNVIDLGGGKQPS